MMTDDDLAREAAYVRSLEFACTDYEGRIAALTAQRDRLLRYVHADEHLRRATAAMFEDAYSAWYDARHDLIAAGDITEDAPETRHNAPGRAKAWL